MARTASLSFITKLLIRSELARAWTSGAEASPGKGLGLDRIENRDEDARAGLLTVCVASEGFRVRRSGPFVIFGLEKNRGLRSSRTPFGWKGCRRVAPGRDPSRVAKVRHSLRRTAYRRIGVVVRFIGLRSRNEVHDAASGRSPRPSLRTKKPYINHLRCHLNCGERCRRHSTCFRKRRDGSDIQFRNKIALYKYPQCSTAGHRISGVRPDEAVPNSIRTVLRSGGE